MGRNAGMLMSEIHAKADQHCGNEELCWW